MGGDMPWVGGTDGGGVHAPTPSKGVRLTGGYIKTNKDGTFLLMLLHVYDVFALTAGPEPGGAEVVACRPSFLGLGVGATRSQGGRRSKDIAGSRRSA